MREYGCVIFQKEGGMKSSSNNRNVPIAPLKEASRSGSHRSINTPVSPEEKWQHLFSDTKWRRVMNVPREERGPKVWGDFFLKS